ncbi:ribosomal protein S5 domain 2-like protein [Mycena pura]|uniref:Ribosomal protein S5 domain 2-like protein n=1 Tax=Mycena pura TaxID=153505 RepID=A0AAD7E636_9AGAR|nr:ribosomal protein S5 domain 2-like protein [Mycena pura]
MKVEKTPGQVHDGGKTSADTKDGREGPNLIIYPVIDQFATRQTPKGRRSRFVKVVCHCGDEPESAEKAYSKGVADDIRNMDWIERFEDRTIWTEVRIRLGATVVILQSRPVGFGLRCNPYQGSHKPELHWGAQGDIVSPSSWSHAVGHGDGLGGSGRKMNKGTGLRLKSQIERERGRRLIDLRV